MLSRHMPELVPTWERLVELVDGDEVAARMLTLWDPPRFLPGCSQAVLIGDEPILVRNYDYRPDLCERVVYSSALSGRRVVGSSDCLWGLLDGVNDAGLTVSLTFGGRPDVGEGFAISLVVRYLLETCDTVDEARAALERVPVHAPQNLTLLDRSGAHVTAYVGPDRPVRFVDTPATTNHQGAVEWPEYARAIRTEERERCVLDLLDDEQLTPDRFVDAFLEPPLHNTKYREGFGTIYTAAYHPTGGRVVYRWPDEEPWELSFDAFAPGSRTVALPRSVGP